MQANRWIVALGVIALGLAGVPAAAAPLTGVFSKGDATKFGEDWPEVSENGNVQNGNSKVSLTGTCKGDVPPDLDLRSCDLVVESVLFRIDPDADCPGELVFDASGRPISAPGALLDDCACPAGDVGCAVLCDVDDPSCLQACPGGKPSEVTFRSHQRVRPTFKLRLKRREFDHRPQLDFSMAVDRAVTAPSSSCPDAWDPATGSAFPPAGHACLETGIHLWCGPNRTARTPYSCSITADWSPTSSGKPASFTNLRTRGEACSPPP